MKTSEEAAGMPRRRSTRLRSQFHPSEEDAGMPPRRSPRLHPQTQASEEGAQVTCRRLHPQIQADEDGAGVARRIRRRRGTSQAAAASLPDDDDMLREILLRLPPQPSSLPRASAVCKRWWGLVTDPKFHRQFYAYHRTPPLLGVFVDGAEFAPMLDPPDRIPPQRFSFGRYGRVLDCRHGRVLVRDVQVENEVAVWDPISGEEHLLTVPSGSTVPSEFRGVFQGAVLCAATDHVHGRCHSSPFKVVLVLHERPVACVYYSETGLWSNLISIKAPCRLCSRPAVLVGNCLYWMTFSNGMLLFDLDANSLTMITLTMIREPMISEPPINRQILQVEDGVVGFAILSYPRLQMWQLNVNAHGAPTWVPRMTVEMHRIPGLPPRIEQEESACLLGYDEDTDSLFLHVCRNVYGVQLKLMQSRKLYEKNNVFHFSPFKSFYTPAIAGGPNAAEMVHIG